MNKCDYAGCEAEAVANVADARGEYVGCYKVCTEHARRMVATNSFGAIWRREWDRYWLTPEGVIALDEVTA